MPWVWKAATFPMTRYVPRLSELPTTMPTSAGLVPIMPTSGMPSTMPPWQTAVESRRNQKGRLVSSREWRQSMAPGWPRQQVYQSNSFSDPRTRWLWLVGHRIQAIVQQLPKFKLQKLQRRRTNGGEGKYSFFYFFLVLGSWIYSVKIQI